MEIRDLMYLEASAAAGNFTHAAKALGINTSTISRRVGRFEDELGLALFERGHAGVRLTSGTCRVPDQPRTELMWLAMKLYYCLPSALLRRDANRTPALLNCLATSSVAGVTYSSDRR